MAKLHWTTVSGIGLAAALVAAVPGVALAQSAPAEEAADDTSSGDIIVTARRKEERLQDVPVAVTALTGENLENYKVTTVGDIASWSARPRR